jgi:hypothetical protein
MADVPRDAHGRQLVFEAVLSDGRFATFKRPSWFQWIEISGLANKLGGTHFATLALMHVCGTIDEKQPTVAELQKLDICDGIILQQLTDTMFIDMQKKGPNV